MPIRKHRLMWMFALLGVIAGALIFVSRAQAETIGFTVAGGPVSAAPGGAGAVTVKVVDDFTLAPILDAEVKVEDTVSARSREFAAQALAVKSKAITVAKAGYVTVTLIGVQTDQVTIYLKPLPVLARASHDVLASGTFGGWPDPTSSDVVQAGLVFRSLSAMDLLSFQVEAFISPLKDSIDVFGPRQIPSNLVLPKQDVQLPISSISLDKPDFRLPLPAGRPARLAGLQGEMSVSDVLPAFQGGGFNVDVLNKLRFRQVGLTTPLDTSADFRQDFDAILPLAPNRHQVTVSAPPFTADVIVASATDLSGDRQTLMPTDIKTAVNSANPSQVNPVSLAAPVQALGQARDVITFAVADKGRRVSGIVTDQAGKIVHPGEFLNVDPIADSGILPETIEVKAPAQGVGAVIFQASEQGLARDPARGASPLGIGSGNYPVWMVYVLPAAGDVQVSTARVVTRAPIRSYSFAQFDFGVSFNELAVDGKTIMRKLARFVRSTALVTGR